MATPPPSQFAALLRRSKFASFDPCIGQVYTTFDGHAARGNFGLKRPLALRRRNAHITVQAVDSREQQTVWRSAEQQNRWIRMWDEVGVRPSVKNSAWAHKIGVIDAEVRFSVDTEFAHQTAAPRRSRRSEGAEKEEVPGPRSTVVPNIDAMTTDEFEKYLAHLRQLRPAFREYLASKYKGDPRTSQTLFRQSLQANRTGNDDFKAFLETHAYKQYHQRVPRFIEQQPHRFAGLSYTHASHLQTLHTTKPHIGRILNEITENPKSYTVASAGMTSGLAKGARGDDYEPVTTLRYIEARLSAPPTTVGAQPQGLEMTRLYTDARVDSNRAGRQKSKQYNPHTPGSREYVGYTPIVSANMLDAVTAQPTQQYTALATRDRTANFLLGALAGFHLKHEAS